MCESSLAKVAFDMALERHLFLGGTEVSDENGKPAILADALGAIIGAVYLDHGLAKAMEVVEILVLNKKA